MDGQAGKVYGARVDFGIIGRSYCGSTLLNYLLGSHPDVYGGSELRRLLPSRRARDMTCAVCSTGCPVWTPQALAAAKAAKAAGLYDYLRGLTGRPVICDASKTLPHFRRMPAQPTRWAVVAKHPLRHVASYAANQLYRRDGDSGDLAGFAADVLASIARLPGDVEDNRGWLADRGEVVHLRYENLITDPQGTLARLLDGTGVDYRPGMLDYAAHEHHPIGGNRGPHTQARRANGHDGRDAGGPRLRREFYAAPGIRMDDKWRQVFTDRQVETVTSLPGYVEACDRLGYTAADDPRTGVYRVDESAV